MGRIAAIARASVMCALGLALACWQATSCAAAGPSGFTIGVGGPGGAGGGGGTGGASSWQSETSWTSDADGSGGLFGCDLNAVLGAGKTCAPTKDAAAAMWSRGYAGVDTTSVDQIAADAAGNVVVTGAFQGCIDLGCGLVSGGDPSDPSGYIAKLDTDGACLWSQWVKRQGAPVAVDAANNVFVVDAFPSGGLVDDSGAPCEAALAKLDSNGAPVWMACLHYSHLSNVQFSYGGANVAVDGEGNIGVAAVRSNESLPPSIIMAKFDPSGAPIWTKNLEWNGEAGQPELTVDSSGNWFLAVGFDASLSVVDVGCGPLKESGTLLAKYDPDGGCQWSNRLATSLTAAASGVAVDGDGNVTVIGNDQLVELSIAQVDPNGGPRWTQTIALSSGEAIAVDATGNLLIVGALWGSTSIGGVTLASAGFRDVLLMSLDPSGTLRWATRFGDAAGEQAASALAMTSSRASVVGWAQGTLDLGCGPLVGGMQSMGFVASFTP